MRVAVLGSGLMGSAIASDISESKYVDSVTVFDISKEKLEKLKKASGRKLEVECIDISREEELQKALKGYYCVASALPHGVVEIANKVAVKNSLRMVDIAFEDRQMDLDEIAVRNGSLLIPGCGLAPGLSGILLSQCVSEIRAKEGRIFVGGLPAKPSNPFNYNLLFSVVGLVREYLEDARIIKGGKMVKVKPFDKIMKFRFGKFGVLDSFYTDGLGTLLYTMKGMDELAELTLRWPGHAEKIKALIDSGLFDREKIRVGGHELSPYEFMLSFLEKKLYSQDTRDITLMRVEARNRSRILRYELVDYYDEEKKMTSMQRTTGYTCSIVVQMVCNGMIVSKGVVPPENAVSGKNLEFLLNELARRGIKIRKKRKER